MTVPKEIHKLLKIQLEKSNFDFSTLDDKEVENFNKLFSKISNFYHEQDKARERMTNSLRLSSDEMSRLYKELETNTKKMIFESKMLTLGEMASGVAHEINNPLIILLSSVEILKENLPENDSSNSALIDNVESSIERIRLIVKGLKSFSRNSENDPFVVSSLQEVVQDSLSLCQEKIKMSNINLHLTIPESPMRVKCRPAQITQVIVNLLNNSRDAVATHTDKWIGVSLEELDSCYKLRVTDSGQGIPMSVQEKLFNPFFTTKPIGLGTGLGLSISKGIVDEHHGKISVDNSCANTCFIITLPKLESKKVAA